NSGNIVFGSDEVEVVKLAAVLERAILKEFELNIKVLVYSFDDFKRIAGDIPDSWTNDANMKSDIWFLWLEVDSESVMEQLVIKPEIDKVIYVPGAILWSVDKEHAARSGMQKVIGTRLYKLVTIRNVNTVRKLLGLMEEMDNEK